MPALEAFLFPSHVMHRKVLALHEAAHGLLSNNRYENEVMGILIGTTALTPLSAYRFAHYYHHAHIGTSKDVELWLFNDPRGPRLRTDSGRGL